MQEEINIVHLNLVNNSYYTGIDKYIEMYEDFVLHKSHAYTICSHKIFLTDDPKVLFPDIKIINGFVSAQIPMPKNQRLLFEKTFWKQRFMKVIAEMLIPHLSGKKNLIFQYHNLFLSLLAEILRNKFGGKVLAHLHCLAWKYNFTYDSRKFKELYKLYYAGEYEKFRTLYNPVVTYEMEDGIICVSEVAKQYIINTFKSDAKTIAVITNGMDVKLLRKKVKRKHDPAEILYVEKVGRDKGIIDLLAALTELKQNGYNFTLKIAGTVSSEERSRILETHKSFKIDMQGQIPFGKLKKLYTTCTIGVVPSLFEQCSYVAIEMAMHGMPMIVSDVDALAEMFEHEKTALLTSLVFDEDFGLSCDKEKLVENFVRLLTDEKLRCNLSKNVKIMAENSFSVDKMMNQTIEIYKQLLN